MVLTAEEKQRIREEEIFRVEVRKELTMNRGLLSRLWKFLNSALGLWILSTAVLGTATWIFTDWQTRSRNQQLKQRTVGMLKSEIGHRLAHFLALVEEDAGTEFAYADALRILEAPPDIVRDSRAFHYFPAFRDAPLNLLVAELTELVGPEDDKRWQGLGVLSAALHELRHLDRPPDAAVVRGLVGRAFEGLHSAVPTVAYPVYAAERFDSAPD